MTNYAQVSVVIPCYRCDSTIARAVGSIAQQTLKPYEVILVDDCSGDGTLAELYRLQSLYSPEWIKVIACELNSGAGTARNLGWAAASQTYVAFLDSDDSWHPQKIEVQYGWMINNPSVVLTGHACVSYEDFNFSENKLINDRAVAFRNINKFLLLISNRFPTPSVMLYRDINFRFPSEKRYCEDYHLWLDICCSGLEVCRSELPLTCLYKGAYGDAGLSANLWAMEKGELGAYKSVFDKGLISSPSFFSIIFLSFLKFLKRALVVLCKKVFGG